MNLKSSLLKSVLAAIAIVGLAASHVAADTVVHSFDADVEGWRFDFGAASTFEWDAAENSPGSTGGALKLTFNFPHNGGIAFTGDSFGSETDLSALGDSLAYDVKVDIANSDQDAFGNYGFAQFVTRETDGYNWGGQSGYNLTGASGDWQTVSLATTGNGGLDMLATRALTLQIYGGPSQNNPGPVTIWVDNIRVVSAVPEPGALSILGFSLFGFCARRRRSA